MTNKHYILKDKKPVPVDLMTWAAWFETADRHVAFDRIGELEVSTVFLGIDHRFGAGEPLLFETMIFGDGDGEYQERYATYEEAEEGHKKAVATAKNNLLESKE